MIPEPVNRQQLIKELVTFLFLTFAATWFLELAGIGLYGSGILANKLMLIPMYIPAVCAIFCMVYFKSAALTTEAKIFLAAFLAASAVSLVEGLYQPLLGTIGPLPLCTAIVSAGAFLLVVVQNLKKPWRDGLAPARLSFGRNYRYYLYLSVVFSALFVLGLLISHYAGLAEPAQEFSLSAFSVFVSLTLAVLVVTWPKYLGEEYGWRFFLQDRMFALFGSFRGVILVGFIWGLWHLPLNLVGLNFASSPVAGNIVYLAYSIVVGIIFSYAVLKTGSIWIAVLLHAITDSLVVTGYPYIANGQVLVAFLPLLVLLGVLAAVLLRSKVWIDEDMVSPAL
jgi:membrane protease YdiL (CAAX protease family)